MKRKDNLYNNMLDINNISSTYNEICKKTKNKNKVYKWESIKEILFARVYNTLANRNYEVGKYHRFVIHEPKQRMIHSQDMYDKLINHLVSKYILIPSLIPCLINGNVASQVGKGTYYGIKLYYKYRCICNRKYKEYYLLKMDINKFFDSINRGILKEKISKKIKEKDSLDIVFKIIDSNPNDHYIKEVLKIKFYIRYQDDMLLIHGDKEYLKYCLKEMEKELTKLDLKLNNKTKIYKNIDNINFIGVRKNRKYANINRTRKNIKQKNMNIIMDYVI